MFANTGPSQCFLFLWPFMRRVPGMTGVLPKSKIRTLFCVFHNVHWKYLQWGWRDIWGKLCDFNPLNHKTSRSEREVLFCLFKNAKGAPFLGARSQEFRNFSCVTFGFAHQMTQKLTLKSWYFIQLMYSTCLILKFTLNKPVAPDSVKNKIK